MLSLSNGRMLPASELEALRNVARSNQSDVLFVGNRSFRLHHISFMDGFSVEPFQAVFWSALGGGVSVSSLTVWRDSSMEGTLFCRSSVCIWSKLAQLHPCRKVSEMKFRAKLTLLHFPLIQMIFPAVSSI